MKLIEVNKIVLPVLSSDGAGVKLKEVLELNLTIMTHF